jgi:hypothetical protein
MNDLESALRAELRVRADAADAASATLRDPVAALLGGIEHQVRSRRRRRALIVPVVAAVATSTAVALVIAVLAPGQTARPRHARGQPALPVTDTRATPRGWSPVPFGAAQISVPGSWSVEAGGGTICGGGVHGMVFVGQGPRLRVLRAMGCHLRLDRVLIVPIGASERNRAGSLTSTVNGIAVVRIPTSDGSLSYLVPSLGVRVAAYGPLAARILRTLTRSPLSVALAPGPSQPAPPSWRSLAFGGIRLAAPARWTTERDNWWGGCPYGIAARVVRLSTATELSAPSCPAPRQTAAFHAARPGIVIGAGPLAAREVVATDFSRCLPRQAGRVCVLKQSLAGGLLILAVYQPGQSRPDVIAIGLAGSGVTARAIFDSIGPAS